ncbi:hypothetical protein TEHAL1_01920 [Tetragenococcus halophilus]|nr:hypothetical protein TEHAL1_01920 [Tetragenococcus halophilus]
MVSGCPLFPGPIFHQFLYQPFYLSYSLIGVLGIARMDWSQWAKFQIKMQGFLFIIGSAFIIGAVLIGYH